MKNKLNFERICLIRNFLARKIFNHALKISQCGLWSDHVFMKGFDAGYKLGYRMAQQDLEVSHD